MMNHFCRRYVSAIVSPETCGNNARCSLTRHQPHSGKEIEPEAKPQKTKKTLTRPVAGKRETDQTRGRSRREAKEARHQAKPQSGEDYSPRRKPWGRKQNRTSPEGAKETRIAESAEAIEWVTADQEEEIAERITEGAPASRPRSVPRQSVHRKPPFAKRPTQD